MKIMKLMTFVPHLAHECLEFLGLNLLINGQILKNIQEEIKLAVQINGKTRH